MDDNTVDLDELLNLADDPEASLLAKILQKKGPYVPRRFFGNVESRRISIEVPLKKKVASSPGKNQNATNDKASPEHSPRALQDENQIQRTEGSPNKSSSTPEVLQNENHAQKPGESPKRTSPRLFTVSPRSPLASYINRNAGNSDRLRRAIFQRSARRTGGRRVLLNEFDNADSINSNSFLPITASTPMAATYETRSAVLANKANENSSHTTTVHQEKISEQLILTPPRQNSAGNITLSKTQSSPVAVVSILKTPVNNATFVKAVEIPETQESVLSVNTQSIVKSLEKSNAPVIVIPIHQTVNPLPSCTDASRKSVANDEILSNHQSTEPGPVSPNVDSNILTDDDDGPAAVQKPNGDIPLNLASNSQSLRQKRLRKRSLIIRRRCDIDQHLAAAETDTDASPPARKEEVDLSRRGQRRRRALTLNKAPRTPINGERYADDLKKQLAGLSNRQILDLRKRNSMGTIFNKSAQKKLTDEEIMEQRNQLETDIIHELGKRNIGTETENELNALEMMDIQAPPPDGFQDIDIEDVFIGEKSSDRVKLVAPDKNKSKRGSKRRKRVDTPEIVKTYLDATRRISKARRTLNQSKRFLFSDQSGVQDTNKTPLVPIQTLTPLSADLIIVPPPPTFSSPFTTADIVVVSPPSTLSSSTSLEKQTRNDSHSVFGLPNEKEAAENTMRPIGNQELAAVSDDVIFKKPQGVAPKAKSKRGRKPNVATTIPSLTNETVDEGSVSEHSDNGNLRRSQRSRKPVNDYDLFWKMWHQQYVQAEEREAKKKLQAKLAKKQSRSMASKLESASTPLASSTANSYSDVKRVAKKKTNSNKKRQEMSPQPNPSPVCNTLEEDGEPMAAIAQLSTVHEETAASLSDKATEPVKKGKKSTTNSTRKFCIRLKRIDLSAKAVSNSSSENKALPVESDANKLSCEISGFDWLKGTSMSQPSSNTEFAGFLKNMHSLSREELTFTLLEGVEYAFYNTEEKNFLGFLRFQPRQLKPLKKVTKNKMHFMIQMGKFIFTIDGHTFSSKEFDVVPVNIGSRYSIENALDSIGVVQVIRQ